MSITTFSALLFCSDELIHCAFKKVSSYPNLYAQTKHIMAVSNDLNLGFLSVKSELEFQIMWTKSVCILNLSLELNYKWQIEHLSDF